MSEQTNISFEAALMIALRADAQKELDTLPTPEQLEELYPDTSQWDERMAVALRRKKHRPMLKRVLVAALTLVVLTLGALAVSADFRKAVYTMIQKFLPIEMQLTYQVDGEPLERLPDGYSDHYVPDGFQMDGTLPGDYYGRPQGEKDLIWALSSYEATARDRPAPRSKAIKITRGKK